MLAAVNDKKRIEQLETALRGVLSYVRVSNPKSLSPRDVEAKTLAILYAETALNPPEKDAVEISASVNTAAAQQVFHPLNPKMGTVVG